MLGHAAFIGGDMADAPCWFCELPKEGYYADEEDGRSEPLQSYTDGESKTTFMAHPSCLHDVVPANMRAVIKPSCADRYGYDVKPSNKTPN